MFTQEQQTHQGIIQTGEKKQRTNKYETTVMQFQSHRLNSN
jgi:hypothetical protein